MDSLPPPPPPDGHTAADSFVSPNYGWSRVQVQDAGRVPCQRSLHAAAVHADSLYVFGGFDGNSRVNDMYEYNFILRRWRSTPATLITPSARDRHTAVVYGNTFYVFGGFDGTSRVNDFWGYNFETQGWAQVLAEDGSAPSPRHSHMAVVYNDSMYIFGGYDGSYRGDFFEYNFSANTWSPIDATGRMPRCRYRASCVVHDHHMIMFGGHDGGKHLNDTNIFHFPTKTWTQLQNTRSTPSPRDSHIAAVYGDSMFVFGGSTGEATGDFYELKIGRNRCSWTNVTRKSQVVVSNTDDLEYASWSGESTSEYGGFGAMDGSDDDVSVERAIQADLDGENSPKSLPGSRFCHVGHVYEDSLYIFGGYDGQYRLNDFICFRFGTLKSGLRVGPSTLLDEMRAMVNNPKLADVVFNIDDDKQIHAHKFMLSRCEYFRAMLTGDMAETDLKEVMMPDITEKTLLIVLEYLYTDEMQLKHSGEAIDIFQAADRFGIPRLKAMCENIILKSISIDNAASIFHAADIYNAKVLRERSLTFMIMHFTEVTKTAAFEEMGRTNIELVFEFLRKVGK